MGSRKRRGTCSFRACYTCRHIGVDQDDWPRDGVIHNSIHQSYPNEEAVMADTRLTAVATAEYRPRTVSAGVRDSGTATAATGHPMYYRRRVSGRCHASASRCAARCSSAPGHHAFAHTFLPPHPISTRVGIAACPGHPRPGHARRAGLRRRRAHDSGGHGVSHRPGRLRPSHGRCRWVRAAIFPSPWCIERSRDGSGRHTAARCHGAA